MVGLGHTRRGSALPARLAVTMREVHLAAKRRTNHKMRFLSCAPLRPFGAKQASA